MIFNAKLTLLFITLCILTAFSLGIGQAPISQIPAGWEIVSVKDIGTIAIPPKMEIQSGEYKKFRDKEFIEMNISPNADIVIQPKSVNTFDKEGLGKYARIIIETVRGQIGDFEQLDFDVNYYTNDDIRFMDSLFKDQTINSHKEFDNMILEWFPLNVKTINGMTCLHVSYLRQLQNRPEVIVNIYVFQNHDRLHRLIMSYQKDKSEYWKGDFEKVLYSFKILNVRK
jgi:hypothetical protein